MSEVVANDHVHVLVSISPQVSVSKLIQKLKGKSSYKLQRESASLGKQYWGQRMWARGYFACSTGNISDEMIKEYMKNEPEQTVSDIRKIKYRHRPYIDKWAEDLLAAGLPEDPPSE